MSNTAPNCMFDGPTVRSGAKVELAVVLHGSKSTRTRVLMSSVDNSMHGKNMKAGRGVGRGDDGSTAATVVALKMSEKSIVAGVVAIGMQRGFACRVLVCPGSSVIVT